MRSGRRTPRLPEEAGALPRVRDVAAYILKKKGPLPKRCLTAILLLAQGWALAWWGSPLFRERIFRMGGEWEISGLCDECSADDWIHDLPDASWERLTLDERQMLDAVVEWQENNPDVEDELLRDIAEDVTFPRFAERDAFSRRSAFEEMAFAMLTTHTMGSSFRTLRRFPFQELSLDALRRRFEKKLTELLSRGCSSSGLFYLMCLLSRHKMHTDDLSEIRLWQEMNPIGREMW